MESYASRLQVWLARTLLDQRFLRAGLVGFERSLPVRRKAFLENWHHSDKPGHTEGIREENSQIGQPTVHRILVSQTPRPSAYGRNETRDAGKDGGRATRDDATYLHLEGLRGGRAEECEAALPGDRKLEIFRQKGGLRRKIVLELEGVRRAAGSGNRRIDFMKKKPVRVQPHRMAHETSAVRGILGIHSWQWLDELRRAGNFKDFGLASDMFPGEKRHMTCSGRTVQRLFITGRRTAVLANESLATLAAGITARRQGQGAFDALRRRIDWLQCTPLRRPHRGRCARACERNVLRDDNFRRSSAFSPLLRCGEQWVSLIPHGIEPGHKAFQ